MKRWDAVYRGLFKALPSGERARRVPSSMPGISPRHPKHEMLDMSTRKTTQAIAPRISSPMRRVPVLVAVLGVQSAPP